MLNVFHFTPKYYFFRVKFLQSNLRKILYNIDICILTFGWVGGFIGKSKSCVSEWLENVYISFYCVRYTGMHWYLPFSMYCEIENVLWNVLKCTGIWIKKSVATLSDLFYYWVLSFFFHFLAVSAILSPHPNPPPVAHKYPNCPSPYFPNSCSVPDHSQK